MIYLFNIIKLITRNGALSKILHYFQVDASINVGGICAKLRELGYKNTISVQNNMSEIERYVNKTLGVKAIEYRIDRKHHFFSIILG